MTDAERGRNDVRTDSDEPLATPLIATMTALQRDLLWTLVHGAPIEGTTVKHAIEEYYDEPIDRSQMYPNLDELVERGLVDERADEYRLTEAGRRALSRRRAWIDLGERRRE